MERGEREGRCWGDLLTVATVMEIYGSQARSRRSDSSRSCCCCCCCCGRGFLEKGDGRGTRRIEARDSEKGFSFQELAQRTLREHRSKHTLLYYTYVLDLYQTRLSLSLIINSVNLLSLWAYTPEYRDSLVDILFSSIYLNFDYNLFYIDDFLFCVGC